MKKQTLTLLAAMLAFSICPAFSYAEPFAIVGPRALGMGGASVAAVNDSTAVYWNPAALAQYRRVDIRIPVELGAQDHIDLKDKWTRINDIYNQVKQYDPAAIDEMNRLLDDLDKPKTGGDIDASTGMFISIPISKSAIAISGLALGYGSIYPTIDTLHSEVTATLPGPVANPNFIANNQSAVTGIAILASEPAISFATSFGDTFFIGANAKKIYARTYVNSASMLTKRFSTFVDDMNDSKTKSDSASVDAGILYAPVRSFRIGVVGRDLNSPSFAYEGVVAEKTTLGDVAMHKAQGEITLDAQYRAGLAWLPFKTFTIAADYDLTRNKTLTPGYESRIAAIGLEKTFWSEYFNIRLGANKNLADSDAKTVYTAGLGLRFFALRLDIAGGYDFDSRQGEVSADLALKF